MYYVSFSEYVYEISPPDPPEVEWGQTGEYGLNVTINSIHRSQIKGYGVELLHDDIYGYDDIPAGEIAHVVIVEYYDGDTFGSSGYWTIPAIKQNPKDAQAAADLCADETKAGSFDGLPYRSWDGYFAGLNSVRVDSMVVSP